MASNQSTVDYILEQIQGAGNVSAKKMFGEYGIYCDSKIVALLCDNELFVKPTQAGRAFIPDLEEKVPYPGAKPYLYVSGDQWDDQEWLSQLIRCTANELPVMTKKLKK